MKNKIINKTIIASLIFSSCLVCFNDKVFADEDNSESLIYNEQSDKLNQDQLKQMKLKKDDYKKDVISNEDIDFLLGNNNVVNDYLLKKDDNNNNIYVSLKMNKSDNKANRVSFVDNKTDGITPAQTALTATLSNIKSSDITIYSKTKTNGFPAYSYIIDYAIQNKLINKNTGLQIIELNNQMQDDIINNKTNNEYSYKLCACILDTLVKADKDDVKKSSELDKIFNDKLDSYKLKLKNKTNILNCLYMLYQNKDIMKKNNIDFFKKEIDVLNKQDGFSMNRNLSIGKFFKEFFIKIGLISKQKLKEEQIVTTNKKYELIDNNINYTNCNENSSLLLKELNNNNNIYFNTYDGMATLTNNELKDKKWYFEDRDNLGRTRFMSFRLNKSNIKKLYNYVKPNITPSGFSDSTLSFSNDTWKSKDNTNKYFMTYSYYQKDNSNATLKLSKKAYKQQDILFKELNKHCQNNEQIILKITPLFNRVDLQPKGIHYVAKSLNSSFEKNIVINNQKDADNSNNNQTKVKNNNSDNIDNSKKPSDNSIINKQVNMEDNKGVFLNE